MTIFAVPAFQCGAWAARRLGQAAMVNANSMASKRRFMARFPGKLLAGGISTCYDTSRRRWANENRMKGPRRENRNSPSRLLGIDRHDLAIRRGRPQAAHQDRHYRLRHFACTRLHG